MERGKPVTLNSWERSALTAVSRGFVPAGGSFPPGAIEVGVPEKIAAMGRDMDPLSWRIVRMLLLAVEMAPVFQVGAGSRLSHLDDQRAEEYLRHAIGKGIVGPTATWLLRLLVEAHYFSSPELQAKLGIDHEPLYTDPPVPSPLPPVPARSYPGVAPGSEVVVDACIVGSGAGGAPSAALLAEAGWSVAVLEEGPVVSRPDFTGSPIDRIGRYYRSNGIFFTIGKPMVQISYASSVGGTTVFNSGTCLVPSRATLEKWAASLNLPSVREEAMRPYFDRVLKFMQVGPSRADILGKNAEVLRRGAEALGTCPHRVIPRPAPGCRGHDECVIGCPTDSKRSMALSYLPRAIASGATVFSRVRVGRVRPGPGGKARWLVHGQLLDPTNPAPRGTFTVRCRHLIVAAGALHTPYLLPSAGTRSARAHRGRHLRIHPSFDVGGDFPEEIRGWRGVLQSYLVDDTPHGILLEATFHPRGFVSTSGLTPFTGHQYKGFLPRIPHLALIGALVMDDTEGRLLPYLGGRPWVSYNMVPSDLEKVGRGIALSGKLFFAAGAKRVFLPLHGGQVVTRPEELDRWEHEAPSPEALHLLAFHPLGSARMAGDADSGALDPDGSVWGAPGLHVSDASMLPGSPGVNPQIAIIALSERNAESWAKAGVNA